jgi:hypothetical protein
MAGVLLARTADAGTRGLLAEVDTVADELRAIWNARGAADRAALAEELRRALSEAQTGEAVKIHVEEILQALDAGDPRAQPRTS